MENTKIHPNSCTRRNFVVVSGLLVVGSVVGCGKQTALTKIIKSRSPEIIRVRIAKKVTKVTIGGFDFVGKNNGDTPTTIEIKPKTTVIVNGKSKIITGRIVLHPITKDADNSFDVIAHVPIEQYLPGVVAGELFAHWHFDTFAAQAVAARSYAIAQQIARKERSHFDVTDGTSSQMFLGDVTLDVAHRAVQETNGTVLQWNNEIIPAYYSACCGGLAASATDAISGAKQHDIPPLCGHNGKDFCTNVNTHAWTANRSARVLRKRLNACAKTLNLPELANIRSIRAIEPVSTNVHGRPTELAIYGRGSESCVVRTKDFVRAANAPVKHLPLISERARSSFLIGQKHGSTLQIDGHGMGHGVGLCQYGAQALAGKGESWQNILSWYYPQVTICT